jgi:hypothetical protein
MLNKLFDPAIFTNHQVIYFTANKYPFNFFKLFFNFLRKHHDIKTLNLFINNLSDWQVCRQSLEISFLGQKNYYWLHELTVDAKTKQLIYKYLASYTGPHSVLIFVNSDDNLLDQQAPNINLDLKNNNNLVHLAKLIPSTNYLRLNNFIRKIQDQVKHNFTIDQLCILIQYGSLVRDLSEFDIGWVFQVIEPEQSLFDLSKHFLFRDSAAFYKSWVLIVNTYPEQFWISFFSEQLFRAYWFVIYQKQENYRLSKQIGFRLPFDFMKSGWQYIEPNLLKQAHDYLYQVDYQLKNSGSDLWLDAFLNKFFKSAF